MSHDCADFWDAWLTFLEVMHEAGMPREMEDTAFTCWRAGWLMRGHTGTGDGSPPMPLAEVKRRLGI